MKRLAIHRNGKLVGWVEVPEADIGDTAVQLTLSNGTPLTLNIGKYRSHAPVLRAGHHPIETLKKIRGFLPFTRPRARQ